ncbi:MAG: hypothetical protein J6U43_03655, partial [Bacteroidales bacterium]|nr:hypothetical protein [Bacteroidales bacterium]
NSAYLAFWASGSFNYYWCMLATLAFLFVYRQKRPRCAPSLYPLYFIFALLIGWSHETLATGIIVATCIEYFLQKEYKHPLPTVVLAGLLIGYSIMVFAPGNFVKLEAVRQDGAASSFMLALTTAIQFKMIFILLLTLGIGYLKQREATLNYISHNLFLIITAGVNMLFCMAIGVGGRAIFFAETTALILILRYLSTCVSGLNRVSTKWLIPTFAILIAYEVCYACDWKKIYTPINRAIVSYIQHDTNDDYITADTNQPMPITAHTILSSGQFWAEHYDFGTISAIHGRPFRILPTSIHRLIKEGSIFSPENRLNEGLEFYTTDSIDFMIMPCDSTPEPVEYIYHLHTPSALDPDIDLLGLLRRKVAPHSYPTTYTPENYSAHPAMPFNITGKHYIILQKPPYRQVKGVYCKPRQ